MKKPNNGSVFGGKVKSGSHLRVVMNRPERVNQHWSMDFVSDSLFSGRKFRVLTVVDDFSRECPVLEADHSFTGKRVSRVLDRIALTRGLPEVITVDNGPEFISKALDLWAFENKVKLRFIQPGKQNIRKDRHIFGNIFFC